ncbi:putative late blight resistance protein -like protein R1B-14 isoform 2 [Capsicum annuum]|nr:putative late blight resistance protein -like protein R1B-14 isoform 2 [Capsicum annuum]
MRFQRYLYGAEINGYVDHEKLEGLETRIKFLADNVGQFCLVIWRKEDRVNIKSKPPHLLCLVVLVELEMKKIFLCELKASKFTQSRTFNDKKLPKGFSHHLHSLLVELRNKDLDNFPNNVSTRKFHVAIEFLLFFLGDVPNHVIDGKRLNELLAKIGVLVGDILYVIQMHLLADEASKIELSTIKIMEKIEDLKAQVEERYYQFFVYSPSQFPTAGGLSFVDSLLRKLNEMSKSETRLDFMMKPHIVISERELSSLISVFGDVAKVQYDHDILKDLLERTINLAYEAEVAIDFIFVQYNALWYSFCSLPAIINEIKHIRAEVTKMRSENLARKPYFVVEPSKHLPTQQSNLMSDEEIVGFEDDTEIIIQYLIRGTDDLDVIPIVGMGGQGKTTCAKKLYNDDIIVSHFDVRAWCTISQSYNWRELLQEIFSQITGSKDKGDKDDILADEVRKILMGKRYLIVLEDIWDSKAWDDLSLCFPDVGNRSRILVTARLEKVGEHVKHYTLNLDSKCVLNSFAASLALNLSTSLEALYFTLYIHLQPIAFFPLGRATISQV